MTRYKLSQLDDDPIIKKAKEKLPKEALDHAAVRKLQVQIDAIVEAIYAYNDQSHIDRIPNYIKKLDSLLTKRANRVDKVYIAAERRKVAHKRSIEKFNVGMAKMKARYHRLIEVVEEVKPKKIVEVGTWRGDTAIAMMVKAAEMNPTATIHYTGYDLFEAATDETNEYEMNGKGFCTVDDVKERIEKFDKLTDYKKKVTLVRGNTNEVMKKHKADIAFIDGGHRVETIENDFSYVKESKVVVFDDYYNAEISPMDLELFGCNKLIDALPQDEVEIFLPEKDKVGIAIWRNPKR